MKTILALVLAAFTLAACGDDSPTASDPAPHHTIIYTDEYSSSLSTATIVRTLSDGTGRQEILSGILVAPPVAGRMLYMDDNRFNLYTAGIDGSAPLKLKPTGYPNRLQSASIAPDGQHYASVDWNMSSGTVELTIQSMDGTEASVIADDLRMETKANFSPDGRHLAYFGIDNRVHVINIDGTGRNAVTAAPAAGATRSQDLLSWSPEWSPSGEWLAVESLSSEMIDIVRADGGSPASLPSFRGSYPVWSPDGTEISCNDNEWIVVHPVNGTSRGITNNSGINPGSRKWWSKDGRRLLVGSGGEEYYGQLYSLDIARNELSTVSPHAINGYWLPE
jgi:Tol biopolymer transport system component